MLIRNSHRRRPILNTNLTNNKNSKKSKKMNQRTTENVVVVVDNVHHQHHHNHNHNHNTSKDSHFLLNAMPEHNFEYKGYYRFGRVLGKGAFGIVVECFRKSDNKPVALKFIKKKSIQKWTPISLIREQCEAFRAHHLDQSEFFTHIINNYSNNNNEDADESAAEGSSDINNQHQHHDDTKTSATTASSSIDVTQVPTEVACLICALDINEIVNIIDYLPSGDNLHLDAKDSGCESDMNNNSDNENNNNTNNNTNTNTNTNTNNNNANSNSSSSRSDSTSGGAKSDESIICIVLERDSNEICLFDYLNERRYLEEQEARVIMKQLVEANLELIHRGIFHGDLKSENILINPQTKQIKIIDFGSAQIIDSTLPNNHSHKMAQKSTTRPVRTFRGTYLYKPPEYLLHHSFYPRPFTVWSFGIILYDMCLGHFPFDNDMEVRVHQTKAVEFTRADLSDSFKDLITKCLAFYVCDRIVIEKILDHPWMKEDCSSSSSSNRN